MLENEPTSQDSDSIPDPNDRPLQLHKSPAPMPTAAPLFTVGKESYKEIAQSLLISMQNARNIENGVTAFLPLSNDQVRDVLLRVQGHADQIHQLCNSIYKDIARIAFES